MKRTIDIQTWERRDNYYFYKDYDNPYVQICAPVDITELLPLVKARSYSFYKVMIYLTLRAVNEIDDFKVRMQKDEVVAYDKVHAGPIVLGYDEQVRFCMVEHRDSLADFLAAADPVMEKAKKVNWENPDGRDDMIYITCIPWVSFTSFSHPMNYGKKADCIPRLSWGKYYKEGMPGNESIKLPYSALAHHSLTDGLQVGTFYMKLQKLLDNPEKYMQV